MNTMPWQPASGHHGRQSKTPPSRHKLIKKTSLAIPAYAQTAATKAPPAPIEILNVSYDPTRELYQDFNAEFAKYWEGKTGQKVSIKQSLLPNNSSPYTSTIVFLVRKDNPKNHLCATKPFHTQRWQSALGQFRPTQLR